jgi:hypothetical protein
MANNIRSSSARYVGLMMLVPLLSGACLASAFAADDVPPPSDEPELSSRSIGKPMSDYETMELHYRRYINAANSMAQLVKQLNQKIQEVSVAAKTVEAKSNSHNKRLLEDKLRQLESARTSSSHQYALLQSQMQNEYRNYAAMSSNLKARYDTANALKTQQTDKEAKAKPVKDSKAKDSKSRESKTKDSKSREPAPNAAVDSAHAGEPRAKEPEIKNLETTELRARRDAAQGSNSSQTSGPVLNPVR